MVTICFPDNVNKKKYHWQLFKNYMKLVENYANAKPMVYQEPNVGLSTYALTHGATVESDNRVVFKNTENGIKTFQNMLESEGYSDKTIEDLTDETSAKNIEDASGVSSSRIFSSLNEQEKEIS